MTEQERAERGWPSVARVAYQRGPFLSPVEMIFGIPASTRDGYHSAHEEAFRKVLAFPRRSWLQPVPCVQPAAPVYQRAPFIPPAEMVAAGFPVPVPCASEDEKMRDFMRSLYKPRIGVPLDEMAQLARGNDAEDDGA